MKCSSFKIKSVKAQQISRMKAVCLEPRRRGATLVELVTTLAILSVLIVALGSTIVLASRAIPTGKSPSGQSVKSARVLEQITSELAEATAFHDISATRLRFSLPGREAGDDPSDRSDDDEVRYIWSGIAGDPMYRRFNGVEEVFIESVRQWSVAATLVEVPDEDAEAPLIEGAETVIASCDAASAPIPKSAFSLTSGQRLAQQFTPNLSGGAVRWRPTRASAYLYTVNPVQATDILRYELYNTSGDGNPDTTPLGSTAVAETSITSGTWHVVDLTSAQDLYNAVPYYLVLRHDSGGTPAQVRRAGPMTSTESLSEDTDSSNDTWSRVSNTVFYMYIWGKPLTEDPDWEPTSTQVVSRLTLMLNTGEADGTSVRVAVAPLNRPEAP